MKKTANTENDPRPEWLMGGNPNAIEAQEAEGQKKLVASLQLPRKCNSPRGINATEQYHKMGIQVFTSSKGDDLFMGVKLPNGWKKEATDHSMWNNLLDDKGRVRANFFYKAAFYDRDAFVNFECAIIVTYRSKEPNEYGSCVMNKNTNEVIFDGGNADISNSGDSREKCLEFLKTNYPDYENINAYWN